MEPKFQPVQRGVYRRRKELFPDSMRSDIEALFGGIGKQFIGAALLLEVFRLSQTLIRRQPENRPGRDININPRKALNPSTSFRPS